MKQTYYSITELEIVEKMIRWLRMSKLINVKMEKSVANPEKWNIYVDVL